MRQMLFSTPVTMQYRKPWPFINLFLCNSPHGGVQRPRKVLDVAVVEPSYRYARGVGHVDVVFGCN